MTSKDQRAEQLRANLAAARERIARAAKAAGRDEQQDPIGLVVVTKTFPASDVRLLAELGVRDVGENRDQEAKAKRAEVEAVVETDVDTDADSDIQLRWHMIGRLQSNKAPSVAGWADVVESVDRVSLVDRLARAAHQRAAPLEVLIQVSLDESLEPGSPDAPGRGGAAPKDVATIAEAIEAAGPDLHLAGVMAVAPHPDTGIDPAAAFARLAEVAAGVRERWPQARVISAGMSGDLEAAIAAGATQVRIGGAILGQRPAVQ